MGPKVDPDMVANKKSHPCRETNSGRPAKRNQFTELSQLAPESVLNNISARYIFNMVF
jgi:myosin heavy subunit